ncbi:MAG: LysM peptidoglycan-binding domain-containing protein [Zoogloea sp.]|nr:LysM peptidoglycan-binding domain-containing protein [Zoogloea sp.]
MIRIISALFAGVAALLPLAAAAAPASLADNAPDSYIVRRGDTLWAISGRFLKNPWQWPQVWKLNQDQIRNPHLIYPGQVVVLDRNGPTLSLGRQIGDKPLYEKRFPQIYSSAAEKPIPSIPQQAIEPFLTEPLVVQEEEDSNAAVIIGTEDGRVYTGAGDTVFAKNLTPGVPLWHVYRKAKPITDPATTIPGPMAERAQRIFLGLLFVIRFW